MSRGEAEAAQNLPWWRKKPLRIFEFCDPFSPDFGKNAAAQAEIATRFGANAQHFHCMGWQGGQGDEQLFFKTQLSKKDNPDFLGEYLKEASKRNIRAIVYFNVHAYARDFANRHSGWWQTNWEGKLKDDLYGTGVACCVNTPWRDWALQLIRDLAQYDIGGIFLDGPAYYADCCYCDSCRGSFKNQYGSEFPEKPDSASPDWTRLVEFQADSLANFLGDANEVLKSVRPDALFYMNSEMMFFGSLLGAPRPNRKLMQNQDLLGAEGGFLGRNINQLPLWWTGANAKFLETQAAGKPTVVFTSAAHYHWIFQSLTEPELRLLYAQALSNGANVYFAILPTFLDEPKLEVAREFNRFIAENEEVYSGTQSLAKAALLLSHPSLLYTSRLGLDSSFERAHEPCFWGFYDILSRSQIPCDILDEQAILEGNLSRYSLLILPGCFCLSDEVTEAIVNFVRNGGVLISSFLGGIGDEVGKKRGKTVLAEVLGVNYSVDSLQKRRCDYFLTEPNLSPHIAQYADSIARGLIASPRWIALLQNEGAQPIFRFAQPLKGEFDTIPEPSELPAVTMHRFGSGLAFCFAGNFGQTYNDFHFPEYRVIVDNIVRATVGKQVEISNAVRSLDVSLRASSDRNKLYLHLTNFTGSGSRPFEELIALKDLEIKLRLDDFVPQSVKALRLGEHLQFKACPTDISFSLPRLYDYEVIQLSLASQGNEQ